MAGAEHVEIVNALMDVLQQFHRRGIFGDRSKEIEPQRPIRVVEYVFELPLVISCEWNQGTLVQPEHVLVRLEARFPDGLMGISLKYEGREWKQSVFGSYSGRLFRTLSPQLDQFETLWKAASSEPRRIFPDHASVSSLIREMCDSFNATKKFNESKKK